MNSNFKKKYFLNVPGDFAVSICNNDVSIATSFPSWFISSGFWKFPKSCEPVGLCQRPEAADLGGVRQGREARKAGEDAAQR